MNSETRPSLLISKYRCFAVNVVWGLCLLAKRDARCLDIARTLQGFEVLSHSNQGVKKTIFRYPNRSNFTPCTLVLVVDHKYLNMPFGGDGFRFALQQRSATWLAKSIPLFSGARVRGGRVGTARVPKNRFLHLYHCGWTPLPFQLHPPYTCTYGGPWVHALYTVERS